MYSYVSFWETMMAAQRQYLDSLSTMSRSMMPPTSRTVVPFSDARFEQRRRETTTDAAEQVVAVGEERLDVQTRRVSGQATRVRRVVKEVPVTKEVTLYDESITIERRPGNGTAAGDDALREREYVMIETREIPVVVKHAQVREELVLRRERTGRVEIVRDTVRHAEVEVQQPEKMPVVIAQNGDADKDHKNQKHQQRH